jgi:hypothetical protein
MHGAAADHNGSVSAPVEFQLCSQQVIDIADFLVEQIQLV